MRQDSKRKNVLTSDSFYYVPLETVLNKLLQKPQIVAQLTFMVQKMVC